MAETYIKLINHKDPQALTVVKLTGLSVATVYRMIDRGTFPRPYKVTGCRAVRWPLSAIEQWNKERAAAASCNNGGNDHA